MSNTKQITEQLDRYISDLFKELQNGHTDAFKYYLKVAANFHSYSWSNRMLIAMQNSSATKVAGFTTWKKLGRSVKKGEKGIKIFAPARWKKDVEKDGESVTIEGKYFISVAVFDIAQTTGVEIPNWHSPLGDDPTQFYQTVKTAMEAKGIVVEEKLMSGGTLGASYGGRVEIHTGQDDKNKALTALHEFAHEILKHGSENKNLSRSDKECQAESSCYLAAAYFGYESPISSDYILNWCKEGSVEALKRNLSAIVQASQEIIKSIPEVEMVIEEKEVQPLAA